MKKGTGDGHHNESFGFSTLFGTDGIRGLYGQGPMSAEKLVDIGFSLGVFAFEMGQQGLKSNQHLCADSAGASVLIGWDTRDSCGEILSALCQGLKRAGASWEALGVLPTAALSFFAQKTGKLAVMISASHNPAPYNGLKFFSARGEKLDDVQRQRLTQLVYHQWGLEEQSPLFSMKSIAVSKAEKPSHSFCIDDPGAVYENFLCSCVGDLNGLNIVLDCANGAFSFIAPRVFQRCGARVQEVLGNHPNGANINKGCGALSLGPLSEAVKKNKSAIGFAFDGDGDRVMVVGPDGNVYDGDHILACLSHVIKTGGVVGTIVSNGGLEAFFHKTHRHFVRCDVGDYAIARELQERGWLLGAEPSGHVLLRHFLPTGDGVLAALLLARWISDYGNPFPVFDPIPAGQESVTWEKGRPLTQGIEQLIKEFRHSFSPHGRLLVRPSGTEPLLRIIAEHPCPQILRSSLDTFRKTLEAQCLREASEISFEKKSVFL